MPKKKPQKKPTDRIIITLDREQIEHIDLHRTQSRPALTRSDVVRNAVNRYFDKDSDYRTLYRAFIRTKNHVANIEDSQAIYNEAFLLFLRYWFATVPNLDEPQKNQLKRLEPGRFDRFIRNLSQSLDAGGLLTKKLDRHTPEADEEADAAAQ